MGKSQKPEGQKPASILRQSLESKHQGNQKVSKDWLDVSVKIPLCGYVSLFSVSLQKSVGSLCMGEPLTFQVQDEADSRNLQTFIHFLDLASLIPQSKLLPLIIFIIFLTHFCSLILLFFSLKCIHGLEFPFCSGLKSYTLHNSNNNILAGSQQEHMGLSILMPRLASAKTFLCCHIESSSVWDCWGIIPHSSGWGILLPNSLCAQLRDFLPLRIF